MFFSIFKRCHFVFFLDYTKASPRQLTELCDNKKNNISTPLRETEMNYSIW